VCIFKYSIKYSCKKFYTRTLWNFIFGEKLRNFLKLYNRYDERKEKDGKAEGGEERRGERKRGEGSGAEGNPVCIFKFSFPTLHKVYGTLRLG